MRIVMLMVATMALVAASSLRADEGEGNNQGDRPNREGRRAEILKQFDKDNSGDLNEEERAAARAAFANRRGQQGDAAGPRRGPGGIDRAALMKQFDKDESGDLNEEERAALREHFQELRANRGQGQGQNGGRPAFDREKIIAEFDKDKDGKLNEEERAAARQAVSERLGNRRQGAGGEGQPRRRRPAE